LEKLLDVVDSVVGSEDEEKVDIAVGLLLGQGNVRLQFDADGLNYRHYLCSYGGVLFRGEWLSIVKRVSSHYYFFYI
jgi:hypothetical protein